ncbi:methionine biosynthesis protein MetW [Ancylobacter sp. VKM B-3255]|uniref:Methionine biosynthesis protein MetW n=2 Tax=Ancylobacter radicis TaxID=2836179 RepID=A0ABS5R792_9HYPH|nr:methionine biosynthesis protein MetW [Ancylobacter radicis]
MSPRDLVLEELKANDLTMREAARGEQGKRIDLLLISQMVKPGSRVLDVGSGDGELLELLATTRGCDARGIELSREGVNAGVARGLPIIQGDADVDLADYPDNAFDYVILSQTIQATRRPKWVLEQMLRIGARAIVSFPNFGFWRMRLDLLINGRMPSTENLPYRWHDTPNIHFCTIRDFVDLVEEVGAQIEKATALDASGHPVRVNLPWAVWNLLGEQAVFLLSRKG